MKQIKCPNGKHSGYENKTNKYANFRNLGGKINENH